MEIKRQINLNGKDAEVDALPELRLLDVLRKQLKLTGTKEGCGEGECGACSVIINGEVVNSCIILFGQLKDGDKILTVEGLSDGDKLSHLQECFITEGGIQCGMCTPGILMAAWTLLMKNKSPTREEIAKAIAGNLCRCTGYEKIVNAIEKASKLWL